MSLDVAGANNYNGMPENNTGHNTTTPKADGMRRAQRREIDLAPTAAAQQEKRQSNNIADLHNTTKSCRSTEDHPNRIVY